MEYASSVEPSAARLQPLLFTPAQHRRVQAPHVHHMYCADAMHVPVVHPPMPGSPWAGRGNEGCTTSTAPL